MANTTTIESGDRVPLGSPSSIGAVIACGSAGSVGTVYQFDPGADVYSSAGAGLGPEATYAILRNTSQRTLYTPATATWGALPSVVRSGGSVGPAASLALANGASGPFDDLIIKVTITTGGALGVARADVAYDGGSVASTTLTLPVEQPAVLRGSVDLNAISYPWSALDTTTLIFSAPSATTITFGSAPTSAQDVVDDFNTLAIAAPLAVRARLAQGTGADLGKAFFELYSTAVGASAGITISAASTGEALLGLATVGVIGSAATWTPAYTGLTFTFPTGTYVAGEVYTATAVGPRASINAIVTALGVLKASYNAKPFGYVVIAQPAADGATAAAIVSAVETVRAAWQADGGAPIFERLCVGGAWHTPSATRATNETNVGTTDTETLTAFGSSAANINSVAHGDVYLPGALLSGRFRRSAAVAWAVKRSGASLLASDVAEGLIPEASVLSPDGFTYARDENTATTKLGRLDGPGFSVIKSTSSGDGAIKFLPGATRAGAASRLRNDGDVGVALEVARIIFGLTELWEGERWATDPQTGGINDDKRGQIEDLVTRALDPILLTSDGQPLNVTTFTVEILDPLTGLFVNNGRVRVKVTFATLGEVQDVAVTISAVGVLIQEA